jgi:Tfp pilus assembly protein PilF
MRQTPNKFYLLLIYAALVVVTIAAFEPARLNGFIGFDDDVYVTENTHVLAGITLKSVLWAFTTPYASNWHPLTWLSHMLDCELFGLNPLGHHLTNLLFHIANTLLLFWVLKRMTGAIWQSAFVAAAFALHPQHVESVAWVAERKDLLSGFFWMLTIAAYIRYAERPCVGGYLLVVLAFCLGLMAKPMVVTLPFVLLLLDYWPLERFQWKKLCLLVCEKIPLFLLAAVSSLITFVVQQRTGAMVQAENLPSYVRVANALVSYISYITKMIYPTGLAVFYPHPLRSPPLWQPLICLFIMLIVSIAVIYLARRYLLVGWLWYLGTLVPVIGLVQVGGQAMADRYTYIPLIGIFMMVAWGLPELLSKWRYRRFVFSAASVLVFAILLLCTRRQIRLWQNDFTLFSHAIAVTENNATMHNNLGVAFQAQGKFDEAIAHYRQALKIYPDYANAHNNLALALQSEGRIDEAINHYLCSLRLGPDPTPLNNLAWLRATQQDPNFRDPNEAVRLALKACEMTGYDDPELLDTLAAAYAAAGDFPRALETAEKALKLAEAVGWNDLAGEISERLQLYKAGKPYQEEWSPGDAKNAK